jgi:hypothetical protein
VSQASAKSIDLFIREVDLPGLPLRQLMAGQEATREIVEYGLRRDSELCGYPLNREAAVRPTQRVCANAIDLDGRNAPAGALGARQPGTGVRDVCVRVCGMCVRAGVQVLPTRTHSCTPDPHTPHRGWATLRVAGFTTCATAWFWPGHVSFEESCFHLVDHVRELEQAFVVEDATGQAVAYVYFRKDENEARQASVLTLDEAQRIAANIAKLPELLTHRGEE